jgi:hypothetical protein
VLSEGYLGLAEDLCGKKICDGAENGQDVVTALLNKKP